MKMTLLEMVQDILSDMDSDEVNSINDTLEAQQVMRIIRTTYYDLITTREWPHLQKITQLVALGDLDKPTHMQIPENVQYVEYVKYNKNDGLVGTAQERIQKIKYRTPEQFLDIVHARNSTDSNVQVVYDDGIDVGPLLIQTNKHPDYWTTFDDNYIVFDSIDNSISGQSTLTSERTIIGVYEEATFSTDDSFIPDLPSKAFSYLLAESKATAFTSINQNQNPKEEQRSRRQRTYLAREKRRQNKGMRYPDYGRKSVRRGGSTDNQTSDINVSDPDYTP